jgi:hypothetical protein
LRLIAEKRELQRKASLVLLDESIYAAGVAVHDFARGRVEKGGVTFRRAGEAVGAKFLVDGEGLATEDLRELAAGDTAEKVHLPEAVLGHHIALSFREVFHGCSTNVGDAPTVALDRDFVLKAGQRGRAVQLRERAINKPPSGSACGDD